MDRGFFPRRQRFPRRHHDQWFQQNYIPNENFWMDPWDMPQNQFPERPPPWWNHHYPEQERPYNVGFDNNTRGSYHSHPYRGRFCTRSKKTLKGRGNFQNQSSSSFSINVPPKKTFEKVKEQPEDSKEFKQDKVNTATSLNNRKGFRIFVKPKDSQPDEESLSQTDSVVSAEVVAKEESPSGITKIPLHTQNEDIVLQLQDKQKDCEVTEDHLSQAVSILSPGVSTEDKTSSCSTEVFQNIEEKDSILLQASQSAQDSSHGFSTTAVEISFLSENANDDQCERREEIELVVAPALDSSSLPSTLNDIRCVPVLMRRKVIELAENQKAWAPEDYQEPSWNVNQADQYLNVSECYKDSVSTSISSNGNRNIESLVKSKSCSPRIRHSINSKHSSTNQTSRDLCCQSPKSYVRQECSSRSFGKRELSTERQDRSSKLSCRRERNSGSSHKQEVSPQRKKHTSKSPYSQEHSSQKWDRNPKTSLMQEHSVKSTHKQKHSSSSPPKMKENSKSQKLDRWKEKKSGRSCCCHCNYHCQQSCSPSRESLWHRCCSPSYLTCKIEHLNVSKEIGNVYGTPYHLSPEKSIVNKKEIRGSRQVVAPKIPVVEKKRKRAKSRTGRKPLKSSTKKKRTSSPCHLNAEEETSVPSWTPKDRSAAVLARKEELEQAYLQVLLNFGVIAIMLVEKEPCMIEAMSSALRANLRKIGDYYECLLKNYIDSLTEAN
ncbi:uncharacterized protein LOC113446154 [Pseudonaja textilis]|uniref:uncharacterized protein LOC113446154 n=1 Tax=Pseudonaja textilis TaxID=8673 RepID=UPI000EA890F2|nr:uncharacterized protein LOC113446154 [Pseudonaja textilis]